MKTKPERENKTATRNSTGTGGWLTVAFVSLFYFPVLDRYKELHLHSKLHFIYSCSSNTTDESAVYLDWWMAVQKTASSKSLHYQVLVVHKHLNCVYVKIETHLEISLITTENCFLLWMTDQIWSHSIRGDYQLMHWNILKVQISSLNLMFIYSRIHISQDSAIC